MQNSSQPPIEFSQGTAPTTYNPMPLSLVYSIDYYAWLLHTQKQHGLLQQKYEQLLEENSEVKREVQNLHNRCKRLQQKKRKRRATRELDKNFECPYDQCGLKYASELALNLHIKNKHDGGTKTEREALARLILEARSKGIDTLPDTTLNLPPNYLKQLICETAKQEYSPTSQDD